jgi:hypothetical protein
MGKTMKRLTIWMFIFIAISMNSASAQTIDINISDSRIWLGDQTEITCSWENLSGYAWGRIIDGPYEADFEQEFIQESPNLSSYIFVPDLSGIYTFKCTNGSIFSGQDTLEVADLSIEMISYTESLYSDEEIEIRARLIETIETPTEVLDWGTEFDVYIGSTELSSLQIKQMGGNWVITAIPSSIPSGTHTLNLVALYNGNQAEYQTQIEILSDVVFDISLSKDKVTGPENITASILAQHHGSGILDQASFSASVNSEGVVLYRVPTGLIIQLPDLSPGPYELKINMHYDGSIYSRTRTISYMVPFHGEVLDAEGKTVPGRITILDGDIAISTLNIENGMYSGEITKGTYDINFITDDFEADFLDVAINSEAKDVIRFDIFDSTESLQGLNIIAGFALEFGMGFDRAVIKADYEASRVSNENRIDVYKCNSWNIDSRTCSGDFRRIDVTKDLIKNQVRFEVDSFSAFVIGESRDLSLEANTDRSVYSHGERIKLTGVVRSGNNPIPEATVTYTLDGKLSQTTTNSNGVFSGEIDVPQRDGPYIIVITASKTLYEPATVSRELSVESKRHFTIVLPLTAEASNTTASDFELSVINTGQTPLTDFTLDITGIPEDWLSFEPKEWSTLDIGEEKRIEMIVTPHSPNRQSYIISVKVTSSESTMTDSFVLNMISQENNVISDTNQTTEGEANPFEPLTSYITANSTAMINNGSLLASFLIFIYIVWKFRARRPSRSPSGETSFQTQISQTSSPYTIGSGSVRPTHTGMGMTRAVKHEILKKPETVESVQDTSKPRHKSPSKRKSSKRKPGKKTHKETPKERHERWENA